MVKIVISIESGKVLYQTFEEVDLQKGEIVVFETPNTFFLNPYYNFDTKEFYEGASPEEITHYRKSLVPQEVQLWRIRTILKSMRYEDSIETVLNNLEEPTKTAALCIWNYGTSVERDSQTVAMLKTALQLTDEQVDEMFIEANNIKL
jgi:hypothetical protein